MHKITNLWKFLLNWLSYLQENNDTKTHLVQHSAEVIYYLSEVTSSSQIVTSEGAVSHKDLYITNSSSLLVTKYFFYNNCF